VVKFFCKPALQSDKLAIPEANSVAHDMKNYSALNTDEDAVLCPYTGSHLFVLRGPIFGPDALASIVSSVGREVVWGFQGQAETRDGGHRCS
jgi:hypothetical protein